MSRRKKAQSRKLKIEEEKQNAIYRKKSELKEQQDYKKEYQILMPKMPEFEILSVQKSTISGKQQQFDAKDPKIIQFNS